MHSSYNVFQNNQIKGGSTNTNMLRNQTLVLNKLWFDLCNLVKLVQFSFIKIKKYPKLWSLTQSNRSCLVIIDKIWLCNASLTTYDYIQLDNKVKKMNQHDGRALSEVSDCHYLWCQVNFLCFVVQNNSIHLFWVFWQMLGELRVTIF